MPKRDWVDVVDSLVTRADVAMDRFRKQPRRRLADVPAPLTPTDPFAAAPVVAAIEEKPLGDPGLAVQIYGKRSCDRSGMAVRLIQQKSLAARMIDIDDEDHRGFEQRLIRETKSYKTPYVYVRGVYLGSFDELVKKDKDGQLDALLGVENSAQGSATS